MLLAGRSLLERLLSDADGLLTATHRHCWVLDDAPHKLSSLMGFKTSTYVSLRYALAQMSCRLDWVVPGSALLVALRGAQGLLTGLIYCF